MSLYYKGEDELIIFHFHLSLFAWATHWVCDSKVGLSPALTASVSGCHILSPYYIVGSTPASPFS